MVTFNPTELFDAGKLKTSIDWSLERLRKFKKKRKTFAIQAAGHHYGGNEDEGAPNPVNFMELAKTIYMQSLASRSPQVSIDTPHQMLKAPAADMALVINHLFRVLEFKATLRQVVLDALFGMGIVKISRGPKSRDDMSGGQTFIGSIDLDDWVQDMTAKQWDQQSFRGHRYFPLLRDVQNDPRNDPEVVEHLTKADRNTALPGHDRGVDTMSRDGTVEENAFEDRAELWELWLPNQGRRGLVVTAALDTDLRPLRAFEWTGPPDGPFRKLGFHWVPNNAMPVPPATHWYSMHVISNNIFNKCADQAERQKTVLPVPSRSIADGYRTIETADGEAFGVDHAAGTLKEVSYGGINPVSMAFLVTLNDFQSRFAGNTDLLGGLSPQSETVGQDRMLSDQASGRVHDMQDQVLEFVRDVATDVGWHLWLSEPNDVRYALEKSTPGSLRSLPIEWKAKNRIGEFIDYNFDIEPYSMQYQSPSDRLQMLTMVYERFILPAIQMGVQPNMEAILRLVGKYGDFHEIAEMVNFATPSIEEMRGPVTGEPRQSPVTTRTNVRISRGGSTTAGKDRAMASTLFGAGVQPKEMAMIGRPTG